ncbi:N-acetyl-gamma-glutamyl-phosphate reductase [Streptococcus chenjunshii]|uniref:N-acetyl-gamma-glutamyl-phosphate reductase n=1 Tax=Streptococcus chenjunshii TaxID=2173853 RepID=A0A372KKR8_9STRE|nr:N-acetyl-gamma-glutamyl-phosphate reductase [Streptococcus chenjunshii]AXQ78295.1 N-acetyl-gamma-glutamyl-phosphate reductase [Streptococcus chenjunshii]RFU50742.1 N-acetyl-gamma-glutamyl-phosphate reductase [Streptococcus chenjunshii]RFU52857.1 N-acetyl-gamma-glutamyl-phosphate reductase [Streptococcus chenjunshii]
MKVSIVGVTGYSGLELVRLLNNHKNAEIVSVHASKDIGSALSEIYPYLKGICDLEISAFDSQQIMQKADLVFLAAPSGVAKNLAEDFVEAGFPVIDLSGDHRLPASLYEKWYQKTAPAKETLAQFTYALSEYTDVKGKKFIANPGCYATAVELALIPLLKAKAIDLDSVIVDAKSGLTGAGKALSASSHFVNVHDNYVTYKLNRHQHIPEIVQELQLFDSGLKHIQFSTSLLPVNRGIMATCYVRLRQPLSQDAIRDLYQSCYADKFFVRIQKELPELHSVIGSNFTDIGFAYNPLTNVLTVVSVIDNLLKGAAGQAVQNFNLMFGFDETAGLLTVPSYL